MGWEAGQVMVPAQSWDDVSTHGFWNRGTTSMFNVRIVNPSTVSYLIMKLEIPLKRIRRRKGTNTFRFVWSVGAPSLLWFTILESSPSLRH